MTAQQTPQPGHNGAPHLRQRANDTSSIAAPSCFVRSNRIPDGNMHSGQSRPYSIRMGCHTTHPTGMSAAYLSRVDRRPVDDGARLIEPVLEPERRARADRRLARTARLYDVKGQVLELSCTIRVVHQRFGSWATGWSAGSSVMSCESQSFRPANHAPACL